MKLNVWTWAFAIWAIFTCLCSALVPVMFGTDATENLHDGMMLLVIFILGFSLHLRRDEELKKK